MSQQEFILFGDVEAAVIDILSNASEITAFNPVNITTDQVGYVSGDRWIEIGLEGGSYRFARPARPRIDITTYAENRSVALDMIVTCQAVLFREQGNYRGHGINFIACQVETYIFKSNDRDSGTVKYILSLRFIIKPE